jgi:hypothetical protein
MTAGHNVNFFPHVSHFRGDCYEYGSALIVVRFVTTIRAGRTRDKKFIFVTNSLDLPENTPSLLYRGHTEVFPDTK